MDNYTKLMLINWIDTNLEDCEIHNGRLIIQIIGIGHRREIYK